MPVKRTRQNWWYAWALCIALLMGICAQAQQDTGGILVAVTDVSGATVKDAAVVITNTETQSELKGTAS